MLVFADQSGLPNPRDRSQYSVLAAVCMHESEHEHLSKFLFQLRSRLFGSPGLDMEFRAKKYLNPREFHRAVVKGDKRARQCIEAVNAIFEEYLVTASLTVFACVMHRPTTKRAFPPLFLPPEYVVLLERVDHLVREIDDQKAVLVFDNMIFVNNNADLARRVTHFLFAVDRGKQVAPSVLDAVLFVGSHITPGVQLADLIAGVVRLYHDRGLAGIRLPSDPFDLWVKQLYCLAKSKSRDFFNNARQHLDYGFYVMPLGHESWTDRNPTSREPARELAP